MLFNFHNRTNTSSRRRKQEYESPGSKGMKIRPGSKTKPHPYKSSSKKTAGAPAKKAPKKVATASKTLLPHRSQARGVVPMSTR
ncbi:hypothetical protein GUJ93_ZPchr0001g29649 [Zizania palustris]|uniref:Uncharacterized protein n=1 Tax=Zizania palustris TaxID=103762 RepID=A0A8J5V6W0_ZIZPA|nr:hypothetical protein GUJ93_ZPchr0001g29649 [Zizania palustris]